MHCFRISTGNDMHKSCIHVLCIRQGKTHIKSVYFSGRTTKVLPSLHLWLSGPLFFSPILSIFFSPIFLLSGRGGFSLPTPLVVRPLKKNNFFYVCLLLVMYIFGGNIKIKWVGRTSILENIYPRNML